MSSAESPESSGSDVYGFKGGMQKLLLDAKVPPGSYKKRALANYGVWHVGGQNRYGQYRPQSFVVPVVERAVRGGATRLMCLVTESNHSGKAKTDSGLVGDPENIEAYIEHLVSRDAKLGYYYRLLNPPHEVEQKTAESPCKVYLDFDIELDQNDWTLSWERVYFVIQVFISKSVNPFIIIYITAILYIFLGCEVFAGS